VNGVLRILFGFHFPGDRTAATFGDSNMDVFAAGEFFGSNFSAGLLALSEFCGHLLPPTRQNFK
jgi:hypothetical protein